MWAFALLAVLAVGPVVGVSLPPSFGKDVDALLSLAATQNTSGFDRLAYWVDMIGHRLSGSASLERGLDLALAMLQKEGFENVHSEPAQIPRWTRGAESLQMVAPYAKRMGLLGLGTSVGGSVTADVVMVRSFDGLSPAVRGKIVVYNYECDWAKNADHCYGAMATYRVDGASRATAFGAVASLTRSLTGRSLYTPHTGVQRYSHDPKFPHIPAACITTEDADLLQRLWDRNVTVRLSLEMSASGPPPLVASRNIVAEIRGSEHPEQIVMLGGHTDSWDVGQGAEDDAAGFMVAWEAMSLVLRVGLRPRRTLRLVGWVCEEFGGIGAQQYFDQNRAEASNVSLVFESDLGVFQPYGMQFTLAGVPAAATVFRQIMGFAAPLNASAVVGGGAGEDSEPWIAAGVPGAAPYNDASRYFDFHHTNADTVNHVPRDVFEKSAAVVAIAAYGVAQLDGMLPRR